LRSAVSNGLKPRAQGFAQTFRTNSFPGDCFMNRFISKPSKATLTVGLGRSLARMTSSMVDLSPVVSLLIDDAEIG
jgi:hypothetical protein